MGRDDPTEPPQDDQLPNAVDLQELSTAQTLLSKVSGVTTRFNSDARMLGLMRQAKAVFVIPEFGHASPAASGPWGAGVLLAKSNGHWSEPVFFTLGSGSLSQTAAKGGALMLFMMNDRALAKFEGNPTWSLGSAPGTSIVNFSSAMPQDLSGNGADIIAWSASGGAHADAQVSIGDISVDAAANCAVYGTTDLRNILAGRTPYLNPTVTSLMRQMPAGVSTVSDQNRAPKRG